LNWGKAVTILQDYVLPPHIEVYFVRMEGNEDSISLFVTVDR